MGVAERRTIGAGLAERLSAYLQVLTQAKRMERERISSKENSAYTNINASQIRRDLRGETRSGG
jgi:redox-sensing transcriptional repressor